MTDLSTISVPRREALAILDQVRPMLVQRLVDGVSRKEANAIVAGQLRKQENILSPYAKEVVVALVVTDEEIDFRRTFGNDFADAWAKMQIEKNK